MMMMTMMTNTTPYRRTKIHIWDKVLMGIWVHPNIITTTIIIIAVIVITTVVHLFVRAQILKAPACTKHPLLSHPHPHHYHILAPSYLAAHFFINFNNIATINITVHNRPNGRRWGADYRNVWGPIQYFDISCANSIFWYILCQFNILIYLVANSKSSICPNGAQSIVHAIW